MKENKNLMSICYEGTSGSIDIRTCYIDEILYFSLKDIFIVLNKENRELGEVNPTKFIPNLIKGQINDLDSDEYKNIPVNNGRFDEETEVFVTQPGLNRIMGNDKSKAGRRFQRWLYHEVVPSLTKHGVYPPPVTAQGSALTKMAEVVVQNAIAVAELFRQNDELSRKVENVDSRLSKLEGNSDEPHIMTVRKFFDKQELFLSEKTEFDIVLWCENLALSYGKSQRKCPSGDRLKTKFYQIIIEEAKDLVEKARG
ncbi:Bro-N domain-containing protein [Pectobacterium parmentieri]|uniref:BRO-like protein n=1 Tax=Pectobacterium parmentieri TaxID=1905730 RepID=A0A8B3F8Q4_PECPM|nr:BRO family protein [Pectobacterium parmentieri]AOR58840.1 BRO-like protein [Pectobacterium parmentieri]AYH10124.1 BRO-like protein [Pectobacterium parmentieri]AYH19165.1 BRO-like protein [Pectobacterium parmentieri]AYH36443.1 BRO-like protein [Pectobacterium parmentieri]AZS56549.1 BRO-like protein [Pectobacterium parmentieri]